MAPVTRPARAWRLLSLCRLRAAAALRCRLARWRLCRLALRAVGPLAGSRGGGVLRRLARRRVLRRLLRLCLAHTTSGQSHPNSWTVFLRRDRRSTRAAAAPSLRGSSAASRPCCCVDRPPLPRRSLAAFSRPRAAAREPAPSRPPCRTSPTSSSSSTRPRRCTWSTQLTCDSPPPPSAARLRTRATATKIARAPPARSTANHRTPPTPQTRYVMRYRHCDGKLILKVTYDRVCLKFQTDQQTDVKKMERLNNLFFAHMRRGPARARARREGGAGEAKVGGRVGEAAGELGGRAGQEAKRQEVGLLVLGTRVFSPGRRR